MRRYLLVTLLILAVEGPSLIGREKESPLPFLHYSRQFVMEDVSIPECTPLRAEVDWKDDMGFMDPNKVWKSVSVTKADWNDAQGMADMEECLAAVPRYKGRYTTDQLDLLEQGSLIAGMPLEFAIMILGPPEEGGGIGSFLDPVTGQPRPVRTFAWVRPNQKAQGAAVALTIFGFLASGVGGFSAGSGSFTTSIRALQLSTAASLGAALAWDSALSKAQVVTVEVTDDLRIHRLMAL